MQEIFRDIKLRLSNAPWRQKSSSWNTDVKLHQPTFDFKTVVFKKENWCDSFSKITNNNITIFQMTSFDIYFRNSAAAGHLWFEGISNMLFLWLLLQFFLISAKYHKMHWMLWSRNFIFAFVCLLTWSNCTECFDPEMSILLTCETKNWI